MDLEERLDAYRRQILVVVDEKEVLKAIQESKKVYYEKEAEKMLSYGEFLWTQLCQIRKRWWLCQILLLVAAGGILSYMREVYYIRRSLGITAVLFMILVIPELWKNRACCCMEIETAAFYSLRQIYAARILLFGIADLVLLSVFCMVLYGQLSLTFAEILVQFLFPMTVTAWICFKNLCNPYVQNEVTAAMACMAWSVVWWLAALQDRFYTAVALPVWLGLFGVALASLAGAVYRAVQDCSRCFT